MDNLPPPNLPYGQIGLMIYSWTTMGVYFIIIFAIRKKRRTIPELRSSFFDLICANAITEFFVFITIEFNQRPRKYRFFNLFDLQTPQWYAYASFFCFSYSQDAIILGFLPVAFNRFTAFHFPFRHKRIWRPRNIAIIFLSIWILSMFLVVPMFMNNYMFFFIGKDGSLFMNGGWFTKYDTINEVVLLLIVGSTCLLLYLKTTLFMLRTDKPRHLRFRAERNLLLCALFMFIWLVFEIIRSCIKIYALSIDEAPTQNFTAEAWYYVFENICSVQCISLITFSSSVRRALRECFQSYLPRCYAYIGGALNALNSSHSTSTTKESTAKICWIDTNVKQLAPRNSNAY